MQETESSLQVWVMSTRPHGLTPYPIVVVRAAKGPQRWQAAFYMNDGRLSHEQHFPRQGFIPREVYNLMREKAERVMRGEQI